MSFFYEHNQKRSEVQELHRLAMDAYREDQYTTTERLLEQAVATAENLDDLPLLIKERYWLATACYIQSKNTQAISTYTWLIGLSTDPTQSQQIHDADSLWYLAYAYIFFIATGRQLMLPVELLLSVVVDGLGWLEHVGKASWAAGLRLQRGMLLKAQRRWQEARYELEAALAFRRRYPQAPCLTLAGHLLQLADLLCMQEVGDYAQAILLAEEALVAAESNNYDLRWAYKTLADAHLGLHEYEAALEAALQSLTLAHFIENSNSIFTTYVILGKIYRATGRLTDSASTVAKQWHWAWKDGTIEVVHNVLIDSIQVRLMQAREACGLPLEAEELPPSLTALINRKLAQRRLASVHRFVQRARPFASQLDQARGIQSKSNELDSQARNAEQLAALLEREAVS